MSRAPIIDARQRLPWHQRLCSDACTLLMWGAWLKLWVPLLRNAGWWGDLGALSQLTLMKLAASGSAADVEHYAAALVGASGTLLVWNRLPSVRAREPEAQSITDYARYFALPEDDILAGRATSVCVVHHDEAGRIVRVERKATGISALPVAPVAPVGADATEQIAA